jgi:hypothetical protein
MKKMVLFLYLSVCNLLALEKGQIARFHRILRQFEYSGYRASDRDIHADFFYQTDDNKIVPTKEDITSDALHREEFSREINGKVGFTGAWLRSSALIQMRNNIDGSVAAGRRDGAFVTMLPLTGIFDSSKSIRNNSTCSLSYKFNIEKHFKTKTIKDFPFIGATGTAGFKGEREELKSNYITNQYGGHHHIDKSRSSYLKMNSEISPVAGLGKMRPVRPVYQAFEIERNLKKTSVIASTLSDQTIIRIAELNASIEGFRLRNDIYRKFLMKSLEEIIKKDSAVIDTNLDAYSLFKVYETFETKYPEFLAGVSCYVKANVKGKYERFLESVWNDDEHHVAANASGQWEPTALGSESTVDYYADICFALCYPVVNRLFLSISLTGPKVPILDGFFYLLITNRLFVKSGINAVLDRDSRSSSIDGFCDIKLYIENNISLNCNLNRNIQRNISSKKVIDIRSRKQFEVITLGVNYDF